MCSFAILLADLVDLKINCILCLKATVTSVDGCGDDFLLLLLVVLLCIKG